MFGRLQNFFSTLLLLMIITTPLFASDQLMKAKEFLKNHEVNLKSGVYRYRVIEEQANLSNLYSPEIEKSNSVYVFKFKDSKRRLERYIEMEPNNMRLVSLNTYNGDKSYQYLPDHKQGAISSEEGNFALSYDNYACFYKEGMLGFFKSHLDITASSVLVDNQKMLSVAESSKDGLVPTELILNPQAGYQIKSFHRHSRTPEHLKGSTPIRETVYKTEVSEYIQAGTFYFPSKYTNTYNATLDNGDDVCILNREVQLEYVKPNVDLGDEIFEVDFPPGTELSHSDFGKIPPVGVTDNYNRPIVLVTILLTCSLFLVCLYFLNRQRHLKRK
ncbi:MAG TPA: hypothetical protein VMX13_06580 [Sedimentisphaerales bacterium]|nr:hypothetical protein [Sedimentisphaerales bacterium]